KALPRLPAISPSEMQKQLQELEQRFLGLEGALDTPERQALWPELASLNAALGQTGDAALCWLQALWPDPPQASAWSGGWCAAEHLDGSEEPVTTLLAKEQPTVAEIRGVAAWLTARGLRGAALAADRLGGVRPFLGCSEAVLP